MNNQEFEFNESQNSLIKDLADKMSFVSIFLIVASIISIISGIMQIGVNGNFGDVITGVFYLFVGIWTNNAASGFKKIVNTQEHDIEFLMGALGELRKLYALQYWLLIIMVIFMAVLLVIAIVASLSK